MMLSEILEKHVGRKIRNQTSTKWANQFKDWDASTTFTPFDIKSTAWEVEPKRISLTSDQIVNAFDAALRSQGMYTTDGFVTKVVSKALKNLGFENE